MIGHLPFAVYALMVAAAFFGLIHRRAATTQHEGAALVRGSMIVAIAITLIYAARFAAAAWFDPANDGDIAWQQWLGRHIMQTGQIPLTLGPEAYAASGSPWVPQEWALSVLVAQTVDTWRFPLLVGLATLAGIATLLLTGWSARRMGASTIAIAAAVFCAGFAMLESYGIRAQVFAWPLLAAVLFFIRTMPERTQWWIVPMVAIWANLHASAMLAPFLLAAWTLGIFIQERRLNGRVAHYAALTVLSAGAVLLTPLGYRLPVYALELVRSPIRTNIVEWQPAYLAAGSFIAGALPLIAATCILGVARVRRWPELLVFAAVTWLAFSAVRNIAICAIVLGPAVAQQLAIFLPQRLRVNALFQERSVGALLYSGAIIASLTTGFALASSPDFTQANLLPLRAIAALHAKPGTHNLYCEDFAWCSLALQYANLREFIDGRCDPFPLTVWNDYETVSHVRSHWRDVLNRRNVDAIVVVAKHPLAKALPSWHAWHLVYRDRIYRVYVRNEQATKRFEAGAPASWVRATAPNLRTDAAHRDDPALSHARDSRSESPS
jgi:hypothetical protein